MLATESPIPQYFDVDGSPLDGGYLYFGTANQNPETVPITAYWDFAGTQPAAQPIRTTNGFASRNGIAAQVYANVDYSLTIRDARGVLVLHARTSAEFSNGAVLQAEIAALDAGDIPYDSEETGYPDKTVGDRIHRDYINVGDIGGTDPTGAVDNTTQVLAAIATGKLVRLDGFYRISTTITNPLAGIVGDGARKSGLICNGVHAITYSSGAGLSRSASRLEGFAIDSLANSCDAKFAVYAPGVAASAAAVYNSGLNVAGLEIGRNGRMGGGFSLKDFFRVNICDVGMTDVSTMIRLIGSLVQGKYMRITSNNDSAASTLNKYGISTETAVYDTGVMGAENQRFIDCAYIRGDRGIDHATGLDVEFINFDTEADFYGAIINATATLRGGIFAPGPGAAAWTGILRGVAVPNAWDGTLFDNVDINCLRQPGTPGSSYGIDFGNGADPVFGAVAKNCRIRGVAGSLQSAIRGRGCRDITVTENVINTSTILGNDIDLNGRRVFCERNMLEGGTINVTDGGNATDHGTIVDNQCTTVTTTLTTLSNWTVIANDEASPLKSMLGESAGTFTITATGFTTVVTDTARWVRHGQTATLFLPDLTGTSNATTLTLTGIPADINPNRSQDTVGRATDNSIVSISPFRVNTNNTITVFFGPTYAAFTAAGTKGAGSCAITFTLT